MTAVREQKSRYAVCDASGALLLETESRWRAWWTWLLARNSGVVAYDRKSWIEDANSWLRCGSPN